MKFTHIDNQPGIKSLAHDIRLRVQPATLLACRAKPSAWLPADHDAVRMQNLVSWDRWQHTYHVLKLTREQGPNEHGGTTQPDVSRTWQ